MVNTANRRMEKSNAILEGRKDDLKTKQVKIYQDKIEELFTQCDLNKDREILQQNIDTEIREHQREREHMERNYNQKIESMNLNHLKIVEDQRREAVGIRNELEETIENMTVEIENLKQKVNDKDVEKTKMCEIHKARMEENELKLFEEFDEIIKNILEENEQDITGKDLNVWKLTEEKNGLLNEFDDLKAEKENYIFQDFQESLSNQHSLEYLVDEVTKKWRNKVDKLEQEKSDMEEQLKDYITYLETKLRDDLFEIDGKWKLSLEQKQNEMDLMKEQLRKNTAVAKELERVLKADLHQKNLENENELRIKLNEKTMKIKEEHKKNLENVVKKEIYNLKSLREHKEINHQCGMEQKASELATMQESLTRLLARKNEIGKICKIHEIQYSSEF